VLLIVGTYDVAVEVVPVAAFHEPMVVKVEERLIEHL
jgi:hypothetical protein